MILSFSLKKSSLLDSNFYNSCEICSLLSKTLLQTAPKSGGEGVPEKRQADKSLSPWKRSTIKSSALITVSSFRSTICITYYICIIALMIKAVSRSLRFCLSQSVEPTRKNKQPQVLRQTPPEVIEAQNTAKLYLEFQALPSDPLSLIRQRFIKKKRVLADRRVYLANKKEYMLRLDGILRQIQKRHTEEVRREHYDLPATVGERVSQLFEQQENQFYMRLIREDAWIAAFGLILIAIMAYIEFMYCQLP